MSHTNALPKRTRAEMGNSDRQWWEQRFYQQWRDSDGNQYFAVECANMEGISDQVIIARWKQRAQLEQQRRQAK